jgi:hypothetical protein
MSLPTRDPCSQTLNVLRYPPATPTATSRPSDRFAKRRAYFGDLAWTQTTLRTGCHAQSSNPPMLVFRVIFSRCRKPLKVIA